ncbi:MAG: hypothetical protein AB8I69_20975 [Anaerolineae bacterium]
MPPKGCLKKSCLFALAVLLAVLSMGNAAPSYTVSIATQIPDAQQGNAQTQDVLASLWVTQRPDISQTFSQTPLMTDRSLALDGSNYPHIAYWQDHLYYAWHDGSTWHLETVDGAWGVARDVSLALDGSGSPHISYHDRSRSDLEYAYRNESGWHIQTVDSDADIDCDTSLVLDGSGNPHIGYHTFGYPWGNLKYAYRDGAGWHIQTVTDSGWRSSLALDDSGNPHISYHDWGNSALKYAYKNESGWHIQTVDDDGYVGE